MLIIGCDYFKLKCLKLKSMLLPLQVSLVILSVVFLSGYSIVEHYASLSRLLLSMLNFGENITVKYICSRKMYYLDWLH